MPKKKLKPAIDAIEILSVITLFALGGWMLQMNWRNPLHVGWIPSGSLLMAGGIACAWLIWIRRGTERATLLPILVVLNSSSLVEHIFKWQAREEDFGWTMGYSLLIVLILAGTISEEIAHRNAAAKDATRELKLFAQEDRL